MSILVLGTVALDTIKTPAGKRDEMLGGSASHFSMSARLFTPVHLVAVIGEDFPKKHLDFLRVRGIELTSVIKEKGKTFRWSGEYRGDLNTAITLNTELGVLACFRPRIAPYQKKIEYVFLANVDPVIQAELLNCMKRPKLVGLDSMNFWIHHKRADLVKLMKRVDIFVANDQESRDLTGKTNLYKAARALRAMGPEMIVIKKGEHGVLFYCDKFMFSLPGFPVDHVVDPTGAGDTFAGGFMGYLAKAGKLNEAILRRALGYATVAASFNVEGFGSDTTSKLTIAKIKNRLQTFKKFISLP